MSNELITFQCRKCIAEVSIGFDGIKKLVNSDCPSCGEESHRNWILWDFVELESQVKGVNKS